MKLSIYALFALFFVSSCQRQAEPVPFDLTTTPPDPSELTMTISPDTVLSNGVAQAVITIHADTDLVKKYYTANLTVAPQGKFSNGMQSIDIALNSSGDGIAYLQSTIAGISSVSAKVGPLTSTKPITFFANQIALSASANSIPADNFTYAEVIATVTGDNKYYPGMSILFKTSAGQFANGLDSTVATISSDGTAKAYLKHTVAEKILVRASLAKIYTSERQITFTRAFPEQITVTCANSSLKPLITSETTITAQLKRTNGSVTKGQVIQFYDSTTGGTHPGLFLNATTSNSSETATAQYRIIDTSFRGIVFIKSYADTNSGGVHGMNVLVVQP